MTGLRRRGHRGRRTATETAAFAFTFTQNELLAEPDFLGDVGKRRVSDQSGTQSAEIAFACVSVQIENDRGCDEIENRVAEKLQAFVVAARGAAMGQSPLKQRVVAEFIVEMGFEPSNGAVQSVVPAFPRDRKPMRRTWKPVRCRGILSYSAGGRIDVSDGSARSC